ncbi:MAG: Ca-activated chloride channel family protein [Glaciecola sp.]|jgi:Ca-activated chloride channel family protein
MASLHRFVIVFSAVTVVGVIQAFVPSFPMTMLDGNRGSSSLLFKNTASAATNGGTNAATGSDVTNVGLNVIGTQNSTHIQQQINIENALIEGKHIAPLNPYKDAQTGQLYYQVINNSLGSTSSNNSSTEAGVPNFTLADTIETDVDISVTGMIARTSLVQTFTNNSNHWVDGLYVFPLPENAAVDHLLIEIDDRKIEGRIKEKLAAKKLFNKAKKAGKKASLVEQRRPNLFSNSIANIGPGETIKVTIEYQQVLRYTNGAYSLRFPLGVTPRYAPKNANDEQIETARLSTENSIMHQKFSDNIDIRVSLNAGVQLHNIDSEHHPIEVSIEQNDRYIVSLQQQTIAMQDYVLSWQPELGSSPSSAHFTQFVNGNEYGLIVLYPPLPNEQLVLDREVIFVLDTSGSMSGDAIVQAKQALAYAIDGLSTRDKFNIIEFNSNAEILWRKARFADTENKVEAFDFISGLTANGGTEMHQALSMALLSEANPELFKQILFITDGSVSNESELMSLITENLNQARLFTIGIGSAPNSYFMTEAAKSGKGSFTFIGNTANLTQKMDDLLDKISAPALTDIKLNLKGIQRYQDFEMYPNVIGDLYQSEPLVISYKQSLSNHDLSKPLSESALTLNQKAEPILVGTYNHSPWQFAPNTELNSIGTSIDNAHKAKGINVLWAREKIAQLTRDKRSVVSDKPKQISESQGLNSDSPILPESEEQRIIRVITETALEHHIVSQYTSLIAVDVLPTKPASLLDDANTDKELMRERIATGKLKRQAQQGFTLPQTATSAQLNLILGFVFLMLSLLIYRFPTQLRLRK